MKIERNEIKSTAHSKYRCQYHIVFAPKYRRKEIYGKLKRDIGEILRKLCEQKGDCRLHKNAVGRKLRFRSNQVSRFHRLVYE